MPANMQQGLKGHRAMFMFIRWRDQSTVHPEFMVPG
jgi:hypothetical protein